MDNGYLSNHVPVPDSDSVFDSDSDSAAVSVFILVSLAAPSSVELGSFKLFV